MKIGVIGSLNMDMVVQAPRNPNVGETITGNQFDTFFGGKGANQCVAAAKLGAECMMIGAVGQDSLAKDVVNNLSDFDIDTKGIQAIKNATTGVAIIQVVNNDNSIIVVPGANGQLSIEHVKSYETTLKECDVIITQCEVPIEVVNWTINFAYLHQITSILNPAPATQLDKNLIDKVTYITPNEHECDIIFGDGKPLESYMKAYPNKLIVTMGENGVKYHDGKKIIEVPTIKVKPVDTTGAGDTFNGAFAFYIGRQDSLFDAIKKACRVAALSVTKLGAQTGMPTMEEVLLLEASKDNEQPNNRIENNDIEKEGLYEKQ